MPRLQDEEDQAAKVVSKSHSSGSARAPLEGTLLIVASMLIIPFMDACAKSLAMSGTPLLQIVWLRVSVQLALTVPLAVYKHGHAPVLRARRRHLLIGRGAILLGATCCYFAAIRFIPLADAVALTFVEPAMLLVVCATCLGERVSLHRWVAVGFGFGGVLLIAKPGAATFQPASILAILTACFFTLYDLSTRKLLQLPDPPPPLILLAYQSVAGTVLLAMPAAVVWTDLRTTAGVAAGGAMGAIGACAHLMRILAFDRAEASALAPLLYTEIVMQTVLGYACWGDFPDALSLVGMAAIVAVGVYLSLADGKAAKADGGAAAGVGKEATTTAGVQECEASADGSVGPAAAVG